MDLAAHSLRLEEVCDYLLNTLNEVLHGFSVDFPSSLGTERDKVLKTLRALETFCSKEGEVSLSSYLNGSEAKLLLKCSRLCRQEFDPEEFETRLGSSVDRADLVEAALAEIV